MEFEEVFSGSDWYDGPRRGVANFRGLPHGFESTFKDFNNEEDEFLLWPIAPEMFELALEDWEIWRRWERGFIAKTLIAQDRHPALAKDRERHQALQVILDKAGVLLSPEVCLRSKAEFESSGKDIRLEVDGGISPTTIAAATAA